MRLYRYWSSAEKTVKDIKGRDIKLKRWAGSNNSLEDAKDIAEKLLANSTKKAATIDSKESWRQQKDKYGYAVNGVPEEVIGEIAETHGITRNRMGCLVLNAKNAMFVDIDLPRYSFFSKLLKRPKPEEIFINRLENWVKQHTGFGVRVYRTAGGLRYLLSHGCTEPDEKALAWMNELGSDPLYVKLCKVQSCFRARLSPKPWRIGVAKVPNNYPRDTSDDKEVFHKWLTNYNNTANKFASCHYLKTVGTRFVSEHLDLIIKEHDRMTKAQSNYPLA